MQKTSRKRCKLLEKNEIIARFLVVVSLSARALGNREKYIKISKNPSNIVSPKNYK